MRGTKKSGLLSLLVLVVICFCQLRPALSSNPDTPAKRFRVGGAVMARKLKKKVDPVYPPEAREKGIEGTVKLQAIIATDGTVKELKVVEGDKLLTPAALDAVKQWVYEPTYLNGELVEIETVIWVNFQLKR